MSHHGKISHLVDQGILKVVDDETLQYTSSFGQAVEQRQADFEAASDDELLDLLGHQERDVAARTLVEVTQDNTRFVAELVALDEFVPDESLDDLVGTAVVLHQLTGSLPRADGVPEGFLPVDGDKLSAFLKLFEISIVYVWLEDCEPCDAVKEEYEAIVNDIPDAVSCFAVYGPDAARTLYDEFDVDGGPVSLFMHRDEVDVRHTGVHDRFTIRNELDVALETAP